jgi:hypothetical protein
MPTLLLALCGTLVVAMVVAGMVLMTPSGTVDVHKVGDDADGSNLSPVGRPDPAPASAALVAEADQTHL